MNSFEEKRQRKIERYEELARKNEQASKETLAEASRLASVIPFGQPILVGHHSESRDRNFRNRIHNKQGKGFELQDKANYYKQKAISAEKNNSIFSDDPEAVTKLKEKIEGLEKQREKMKAYNKAWRKYASKKDDSELRKLGLNDSGIAQLQINIDKAYSWEKQPYPKYLLSNLGQNISRLKKRLASLEAHSDDETTEAQYKGAKLVDNVEENRVQILFDDIPPVEVRTEMKQNGFRWSRYNKAWQRHRSFHAKRLAEELLNKYYN